MIVLKGLIIWGIIMMVYGLFKTYKDPVNGREIIRSGAAVSLVALSVVICIDLLLNGGKSFGLDTSIRSSGSISYSIEIDSPWQQEQTDRQSKREQRLLLSRQKRSLRIKTVPAAGKIIKSAVLFGLIKITMFDGG